MKAECSSPPSRNRRLDSLGFPKVAVRGQLGGSRCQAALVARYACIGNGRHDVGEAIFKQVEFGEGSAEVLGDDPVGVVEGKPHADGKDAAAVVCREAERAAKLGCEAAVVGDCPRGEPPPQPFVAEIHS